MTVKTSVLWKINTHMAKKWPEKVVQRSFIKEHSFPFRLQFKIATSQLSLGLKLAIAAWQFYLDWLQIESKRKSFEVFWTFLEKYIASTFQFVHITQSALLFKFQAIIQMFANCCDHKSNHRGCFPKFANDKWPFRDHFFSNFTKLRFRRSF